MSRKENVLVFGERPTDAATQRVLDMLSRTAGKLTALLDVCLLASYDGVVVTDAAADPGTALTRTRTTLDFLDAGIDSVRLIVRGQNSAAGSVTVQAFNLTQPVATAVMATATITDATEQTADSGWQPFTPAGGDEAVEVRVVGDGSMDPELFSVHLQARSVKA